MAALTLQVCRIPAGIYPIGDESIAVSSPAHRVTLAAYAIGARAVTNQNFALFIAAGGYEDQACWGAMGWRWQKHKWEIAPAFWDDPQFNAPLQPVVGLGWYEADAFARWLARESGIPWRLPTEVEWEAATRGPEGHAWPGGKSFKPQRCNAAELGLGRPWAVSEEGNISWCGAVDLCGNVWEWCSSRWGRNWQTLDYPYPYYVNDGRENLAGSHARVMRGGSWFNPLAEANPANRGRYLPGSRGSNIGFRLAYSSD